MYFFLSLVPATVVVIVGYFVLFSATRAQAGVKTFGQILAAWLFVLAVAFPAAGAYATFAGIAPIGEMMRSMH